VFQGKVYGHLVAIKVFNEDGGSWDDKQIQAEIKLLCSVRHPHINKLLAVSFNGPNRCLVLDFMDAGSLDDRVFAKPLLQWKERAAILLHTARGLAHLHSLDPPIVHRDVKSANVLLKRIVAESDDGGGSGGGDSASSTLIAQVADFGTSRVNVVSEL
jgi:serine/threonine protein kinase